jgi:poly(ADP-ribose) glycohydrolase ARH3
MRAPALGLYFAADELDAVAAAAEAATVVTHAHPLAREGAVLVACATALALQGARAPELLQELATRARSATYAQRLATASAWLASGREVPAAEVAGQLGNGVAAVDSCVTAIYLAARFDARSIDELLAFTRQLGGDVDTIGAMAAAIWGAAHGADALPPARLQRLEDYPRLHGLAHAFAAAIGQRPQAECSDA